jgi:hypothetical protein
MVQAYGKPNLSPEAVQLIYSTFQVLAGATGLTSVR